MLDRFTVKDFKSLVDVTIDPGIVNVFIGANGSGKSNLLEAVGILGAAASGRVNDESLKYRGVRPGLPTLYKSSFKNRTSAQYIRFEAEGFGASYSVSLLNPNQNPTPDWTFKAEQLMRGKEPVFTRNGHSPERLNNSAGLAALRMVEMTADDSAGKLVDLLRNYAIYAPNTPTLRGLEPDPQSREPVGLAGGRLPHGIDALKSDGNFDELLTELFSLIDWVDTLGTTTRTSHSAPLLERAPHPPLSLRFRDRFMQKGRDILSGEDASEGVLYLLFFAVLALHPKTPQLLAIDNFDQALNPRLAREFTTRFCHWLMDREDRQILLTTHNPLVLDGLPLSDDRIRLFAVDRNKRGYTVVHRVKIGQTLLNAAERGIPLSTQWVSGAFGEVPSGV